MTRFLLLALVVFINLMTGCSTLDGRPSVAFFDPAPEMKLKSASHWRTIADDVVGQIAPIAKRDGMPIFVSSQDATTFGRVFASQLRSSLISRGVSLSDTDAGALSLAVLVDEVTHVTIPRYQPGSLTVLSGGVLVVRDAFETANRAINSTAGLLIAGDIIKTINEKNTPPDTEIVMTVKLMNNSRYAIHRTDIYYIDSVDSSLFVKTGKVFPLVGGDSK